MAIQANRFSCGGYVAHKLRVPSLSSMRFSAWFDDAGELLEAEGYDRRNRARPASSRIKDALAKSFPVIKQLAEG